MKEKAVVDQIFRQRLEANGLLAQASATINAVVSLLLGQGASMVDFNVERIEPVILRARPPLSQCAQMSPYVWCETKGGPFFMMMRAVAAPLDGSSTGAIYYGVSQDGVTFDMDA